MMHDSLIKHAELDPNNKYTDTNGWDIFESLGYLPAWVANPEYSTVSLKEAMDAQYGWGLHEMKGGVVNDDLSYSYPEDPTLYPLCIIIRESEVGTETFIQYEHAIVAFKQADGSTYVCRMD